MPIILVEFVDPKIRVPKLNAKGHIAIPQIHNCFPNNIESILINVGAHPFEGHRHRRNKQLFKLTHKAHQILRLNPRNRNLRRKQTMRNPRTINPVFLRRKCFFNQLAKLVIPLRPLLLTNRR
jgi:hypothetical protein